MSGWCVSDEHEKCPDNIQDMGECSCPCHMSEEDTNAR